MAYEIPGRTLTLLANADLSAVQFTGVALDNTGKGGAPSAGASILGILQNKPTSGQEASVMLDGVSKMLVGSATVTAGDKVMVDSAGKAVTATSTNFAIGWALTTGAASTIITVALIPGGKI